MEAKIYPIIPSTANPAIVMIIPLVLFLIMAGVFGYISYSMKNVTFELSSKGIKISGDMYARFIPSASLMRDKARIIDVMKETGYRTSMRTNGIALPGYTSGWFRIRNGEKVLRFVTDTKAMIYIPTKDGYSLMISPQNPEEFLEDLKKY